MIEKLKIGLTEQHGMAVEQKNNPPSGIDYQFLDVVAEPPFWLRSPIKGFGRTYQEADVDVIEAVLSPIITSKPWFYSLACYEEAIPFDVFGLPLPKPIRNQLVCSLFKKPNFKSLIFWSEAGKKTLASYGGFAQEHWIWNKSEVLYPAIKEQKPKTDYQIKRINLLFNGNFFIKGGANVVDAFERLQQETNLPVNLTLCCDENLDFHVGEVGLREYYLRKIKSNPDIKLGRVSREVFVNQILPNTDIYLLPSYGDAFGFAILEAMSFGIPVIASNYMAIPEMIDHDVEGYLIDVKDYHCQKMFPGCYVNTIPESFKNHVTNELHKYIQRLVQHPAKRKILGQAGQHKAVTKFSFTERNRKMLMLMEKYL